MVQVGPLEGRMKSLRRFGKWGGKSERGNSPKRQEEQDSKSKKWKLKATLEPERVCCEKPTGDNMH